MLSITDDIYDGDFYSLSIYISLTPDEIGRYNTYTEFNFHPAYVVFLVSEQSSEHSRQKLIISILYYNDK